MTNIYYIYEPQLVKRGNKHMTPARLFTHTVNRPMSLRTGVFGIDKYVKFLLCTTWLIKNKEDTEILQINTKLPAGVYVYFIL